MASLLHRMLCTHVLLLLLLCLHMALNNVSAAPSADWTGQSEPVADKLQQDRRTYFRVLNALMAKLQEVKKKRTRPDGGFFSRHDAMNDYLQSAYANELAMDLYGPGKKK